jgi:TRAP-type C4-dicarboxylate transport system permease small subunit
VSNAHPLDEPGHQIETIASGPGRIENASEAVASLALIAMILLIGSEAIVRNVFHSSLEITDEICGYLLVAVTFLSMSVSEAHGAFHRVELIQARMSFRARVWLQIGFDLAALVASALVTWQLTRLALNAWNSGDVAPTPLQTPLWLPQMVMGLGMAFLCVALLRSMQAKYRRLRAEAVA